MWNPKIITVCLVMAIIFSGCLRTIRIESKIFPNVKLKPNFRYEGRAYKETIESLLAEIWTSGFLMNNGLVREEIINNNYGFFCKSEEYTYPKKGAAYYKKEAGKSDKIMLHKNLFPHTELHFSGKVILRPIDKNIRAALVHELFHDFWYSLLDRDKRFQFSMEAELFYLELDMARSGQDKVRFLRSIGMMEPAEEDFKGYQELKDYKEHYTNQRFYGT
jgi:hypothetical protein